MIREGWLYSNQIEGWLFPNLHVPYDADVHHAQFAQQGIPKGGLRLLLSTSKTSNADKTVIMPWSQTTFEQICQKLSAPQHIIDILTQTHRMSPIHRLNVALAEKTQSCQMVCEVFCHQIPMK